MNIIKPYRLIKVNNEETYFLAFWISDNGIVLQVSGPETHLLHTVNATEYDGSPLQLKSILSDEECYAEGYQAAITNWRYFHPDELKTYPDKFQYGYKDGKDKLIADAYK